MLIAVTYVYIVVRYKLIHDAACGKRLQGVWSPDMTLRDYDQLVSWRNITSLETKTKTAFMFPIRIQVLKIYKCMFFFIYPNSQSSVRSAA